MSHGAAIAERWFEHREWTPLDFQREVWRAYERGESGLVHAATGTGKTLAAWWGPLLEWIHETQFDVAARATKLDARARLRAPSLGGGA